MSQFVQRPRKGAESSLLQLFDTKILEDLRHARLPRSWRQELSGADPATVLIMLWAGRLSMRVQAFYQNILRAHGLHYSDYALLSILRFSGPLSPKALNRYLAITSGGLTKSVDRLERGGLVRRRPDPNDGRGVLVSLTGKGRRTGNRIFEEDLQAHERLFENLGKAHRRRIAAALRDLLDAFEEPAT